MKLFLRISFLGTAYSGYQAQSNAPSVQAELNKATERLFRHPCDICGCSRTDGGVHANEFCLTVCEKGTNHLETAIKRENIVAALNTFLPRDISVLSADWRDENFHARYDVVKKEYLYRIYDKKIRNPFLCDRAYHFPVHIDDETLQRMNEAAGHFVGKHDFRSFMAAESRAKNTERTVFSAYLARSDEYDGMVELHITGDGFLYNMVRIVCGTLLNVAKGKTEPSDIPRIIAAKDRTAAGPTVPGHGLYLNRVFYRDDGEETP